MTSSRLSVGALLLVAACASPAARPRVVAPAPPPDDAVELAALLPARAERCTVVRPGRVPERRRELLIRQSWGDRHAWDTDLGVTAYVRAEATDAEGRRALRSYFRFGGTADEVRERAERLPYRWDHAPCQGIACGGAVARWVDERTVEVAHYDWPTAIRGFDAADCLRLARRRADAVEVAIRAGPPAGWAFRAVRYERAIIAGRRGVDIAVAIDFAYDADAEQALAEAPAARIAVLDSLSPLEASDRRIERSGTTLHVRDTYSWPDLELARADHRLEAEAAADLARRAVPVPVAQVEVSSLAVVRHQVRLRSAALERTRGPGRAPLARSLAALLERAFAAHPAELGLAERLARLRLSDLDEPEGARALAEGVLASGVASDPEPWRSVRREAAAAAGPDALAARLVEDGLVASGAEAARAAEDLVRLRAEGVAFEWAEGAWRLGRELPGGGDAATAHGTLSRRGVLGALVVLARLQHPGAGVTLQVAVATAAEHAPHAVGRAGPELVVTRGRRGGSVLVAALGTQDLLEVRRLAEQLDPLVGSGPATYAVSLRDPREGREAHLRLEGVVRGDALHLRSASRAAGGVAWSDVERLVARPIASLPPALFPPPELTVRAASAEEGAALWREADGVAPGACGTAGPILRCRAPGRPELLGELVHALARAGVDGLVQPPP